MYFIVSYPSRSKTLVAADARILEMQSCHRHLYSSYSYIVYALGRTHVASVDKRRSEPGGTACLPTTRSLMAVKLENDLSTTPFLAVHVYMHCTVSFSPARLSDCLQPLLQRSIDTQLHCCSKSSSCCSSRRRRNRSGKKDSFHIVKVG